MREDSYREADVVRESMLTAVGRMPNSLPGRLLTAFEVAELIGCHEESVRRAYLCG